MMLLCLFFQRLCILHHALCEGVRVCGLGFSNGVGCFDWPLPCMLILLGVRGRALSCLGSGVVVDQCLITTPLAPQLSMCTRPVYSSRLHLGRTGE